MALSPGTRLGAYEIVAPIGSGGMGEVFVARHVGIDRRVALKVVRSDFLANPTARARFEREARACGSLRHPNVVNVTDYGVTAVGDEPIAFLVMEYVTGQRLADLLGAAQILPMAIALDLTTQIADALAAAHQRGIVHRDLKPANILVTPDHRGGFSVTLLDFGIATLRDEAIGGRDGVVEAAVAPMVDVADGETIAAVWRGLDAAGPLTRVGDVVGTPAYMSPEQCVGDVVDERTDVFALGVVVYQMLAGELPFSDDLLTRMRQRDATAPDVRARNPRVTPEAAAVISRALDPRADKRFGSVQAFAAALRATSLETSGALREAIAVFAQRFPDLWAVMGVILTPSIAASLLGAAAIVVTPPVINPRGTPVDIGHTIALILISIALMFSVPMAMASISSVFDTLKRRPFEPVSARAIVRRLAGRADGFPLLRALTQTFSQYLRTSHRVRSTSMRNMLAFVGHYRGMPDVDDARILRMESALPSRIFGTMVMLQFGCSILLPVFAGLAAYGLLAIWHTDRPHVAEVVAAITFPIGQVLQALVALVDVIMFDLAYDASVE